MRASEKLRSFEARVGGTWSISWQAYFLSVPLSILAIVGSAGRSLNNFQNVFSATSIGIATTVSIGILLLILKKTTHKNRRKKPVSLMVAIFTGFAAGSIFTSGIILVKLAVGLNIGDSLWGQLVSNSILITWWGMTTTVVLEDREVFTKKREEAIASAIELELINQRGSATEERLRKSLNKRISNEISEARSVLNAALRSVQSEAGNAKWQPLAQLLRSIANDVMRPLSKKLWNSASVVFPRPSFFRVLKTIVYEQPLRPVPMTLIVVLLSTETLIKNFGVSYGTMVLMATVIAIWLMMPLANKATQIWPKGQPIFFMLTVVSFQIFDTLAWMWAGTEAKVEVSVSTLGINVIASLVLILLTSGFGAYGNLNQKSLETFRRDLSKRELATLVDNRVISALALAASRTLHGRVQTRLISCAAAVDRAERTGDIDLLNRALVEVNEIFDAASLGQPEDSQNSLQQLLTEIAKPWKGICRVSYDLDPQSAQLRGKLALDLSGVVEEAITNSVRHGGASHVEVSIKDEGGEFEVSISDNGQGFSEGSPGVGSELIRLVSRGNFKLTENQHGGCNLDLRVPKAGH